MQSRLISIVIPSFNSECVIRRSVDSVLNQTYQDIELWVIDDGSQDHTLDILNSYNDPRLHIYALPNNTGSPAQPRNEGISRATGKYIAFLDSDDYWEPNKLEIQLREMIDAASPFSCTNYIVKAVNGAEHTRRVPRTSNFCETLALNKIGCSTVIIEKDLVTKYMFSDVRLEDYNLWLSILKDGYSILGVEQCLMTYVQSNVSRSKFDLMQAKAYVDTFRRFGKPNLYSALFHCCKYLLRRLVWARL
ncbi:glycosyltransferase family 2 protein [Vibrio sp. SCSIO 43133]|uniref:glycosyltransferase family 2 protein n=1 Tax=Vibrio sp. SCSIO 43133 TaxID=2802577 RepID=UPI0021896DCD|nr:glycosyltransferase family 2 protein [Vibrio sp. SCSIO 43133]